MVDWHQNGSVCDANKNVGAYSCDGTYSVTYYLEERTLSFCYDDMSGSTQTKVETRVGAEASREHVDGQCGWEKAYRTIVDWHNTGEVCDAAGVTDAYNCDALTKESIYYHQQMRELLYCYPDGSEHGSSDPNFPLRYEYRSSYEIGEEASRRLVEGQCGYNADIPTPEPSQKIVTFTMSKRGETTLRVALSSAVDKRVSVYIDVVRDDGAQVRTVGTIPIAAGSTYKEITVEDPNCTITLNRITPTESENWVIHYEDGFTLYFSDMS